MARDRRRRGSSRVLALVGAAFALYCVALVRLHLWTQQADGGSHQVGPGAGEAPDAPVRELERQLDNPRAAGNLRDGAGGEDAQHIELKEVENAVTAQPRVERNASAPTAEVTTKPAPTIPVRPAETAAATPVATTAAAVLDRVPPLEAAPQTAEAAASVAPAAEKQPQADAQVEAQAPQHPAGKQLEADTHVEAQAPQQPGGKLPQQQQLDQPAKVNETLALEQLDVIPPVTETTAPPSVEVHVPFRDRHQVIAGYEKLMAFLENYMASPDESLFLFFVCSDKRFHPDDWSPMCTTAKQHVYSVFANSPSRNRLVTVLAGSERYWKFANAFYDDADIRLKGVPCIMKWEGHRGRTSGMMFDESLQYDVFLRYLFGNVDKPDPLLTPANMEGKQIITVNGYEAYQQKMAEFKREKHPVTTFMIMVSGRFKANNRPWCPYCRYSELPIEYVFYAYAPPRSRLLRVEVTNSYNAWKHPNQFNRDKELDMHVVPALYRLQITPPVTSYALTFSGGSNVGSIQYERHKIRLDLLESLREVFAMRKTL